MYRPRQTDKRFCWSKFLSTIMTRILPSPYSPYPRRYVGPSPCLSIFGAGNTGSASSWILWHGRSLQITCTRNAGAQRWSSWSRGDYIVFERNNSVSNKTDARHCHPRQTLNSARLVIENVKRKKCPADNINEFELHDNPWLLEGVS